MSRIASLKHTGSGGTVSSRSSRNTIPRTFSGSIRMFHRGPPASGSLTLVIAADRDVIFFQDWGTFRAVPKVPNILSYALLAAIIPLPVLPSAAAYQDSAARAGPGRRPADLVWPGPAPISPTYVH